VIVLIEEVNGKGEVNKETRSEKKGESKRKSLSLNMAGRGAKKSGEGRELSKGRKREKKNEEGVNNVKREGKMSRKDYFFY
jgi:hypothetical protein